MLDPVILLVRVAPRRGFRDSMFRLMIKLIAAILPVHQAQLHTYLHMSGLRIG